METLLHGEGWRDVGDERVNAVCVRVVMNTWHRKKVLRPGLAGPSSVIAETACRMLTPNTSILSHQYSWGSDGKHHELFAMTKEFGLAQQRMMDHYRVTTGLDEEVIKQRLLPASDVYLSAEEALALGICDFISDLKK